MKYIATIAALLVCGIAFAADNPFAPRQTDPFAESGHAQANPFAPGGHLSFTKDTAKKGLPCGKSGCDCGCADGGVCTCLVSKTSGTVVLPLYVVAFFAYGNDTLKPTTLIAYKTEAAAKRAVAKSGAARMYVIEGTGKYADPEPQKQKTVRSRAPAAFVQPMMRCGPGGCSGGG